MTLSNYLFYNAEVLWQFAAGIITSAERDRLLAQAKLEGEGE
jgi:hypothetical protein